MTKNAKRILGFIGSALGALGMALCLAVIIGAWWVNGPLTAGLLTIFPPIEAALAFGDTTAERFGTFVGDAQTQLNETADAKPIATALSDEIEQVTVYVNVANELASSAEETLTGVAVSAEPGVRSNVATQAANRLSTTMDSASETLNAAEVLAQDVRDGRTEKVDQLNNQLDLLEANAAEVQSAISQTSGDVAEIKLKIPRWVNLGSLIVTLIFLWFGVAQYLLLRSGWRWVSESVGQ